MRSTRLERYFAFLDGLQARWSDRWREHANRRTTIVIVLAGVIATVVYLLLVQPPRTFPVDRLVTVESGKSVGEIAHDLEAQGVVRSAVAFRVLVMLMGTDRSVHAGDYLFKEPRDVFSVARAMSVGNFGLEPIRIRIPEGATTRSMAIIYRSNLERFNEARFLERAQPLEGYLFPDTYFFMPNATEDTVIDAMRQNFDIRIAELEDLIAASGRTKEDIIIMASILEREARIYEDRRMIAGVLWNRIKRGMALQVDAAFLYFLGKSTFELTREDLATDSPYNTYKYKGLPPGPIGSPSLAAIRAAADPAANNYLYYLADNTGVTHYSRTYEEHLRKKNLYLGP